MNFPQSLGFFVHVHGHLGVIFRVAPADVLLRLLLMWLPLSAALFGLRHLLLFEDMAVVSELGPLLLGVHLFHLVAGFADRPEL